VQINNTYASVYKLYIPAENWIAKTICDYCTANSIGNASISGIGSIKNIWILINDGKIRVKNFNDSPFYEMTSISGICYFKKRKTYL